MIRLSRAAGTRYERDAAGRLVPRTAPGDLLGILEPAPGLTLEDVRDYLGAAAAVEDLHKASRPAPAAPAAAPVIEEPAAPATESAVTRAVRKLTGRKV